MKYKYTIHYNDQNSIASLTTSFSTDENIDIKVLSASGALTIDGNLDGKSYWINMAHVKLIEKEEAAE